MLILDSGGLTHLARDGRRAAVAIATLRRRGLWPPVVPSMVVAESVTGDPGRDALVNRVLKACVVDESVPLARARRAAALRAAARRGSAVDALVAASAEGGGVVLAGDDGDLGALAASARAVTVVAV